MHIGEPWLVEREFLEPPVLSNNLCSTILSWIVQVRHIIYRYCCILGVCTYFIDRIRLYDISQRYSCRVPGFSLRRILEGLLTGPPILPYSGFRTPTCARRRFGRCCCSTNQRSVLIWKEFLHAAFHPR